MKHTKQYINGKWIDGVGTFNDYSPATGEIVGVIADADRSIAQKAIEAAAAAFPAWSALDHVQRAKYLNKMADILEARKQDFIDALIDEGGYWIGKAMFETGYSPGNFRAAAAATYQVKGEILPSDHGKVSMIVREPLGVVTGIAPWNFPLLLGTRSFAMALAVGNTIVSKPAEDTPLTGVLLAEVCEEAGLPPGVFNLITCSRDTVDEVGDEIVINKHIKAISFTGSTAVGKAIAAKAGAHLKKACMELGGQASIIVMDDADMNKAVEAATFGAYMNHGQICMSSERIIVHKSLAKEFTERMTKNVASIQYGLDLRNPANAVGPIINQKQADRLIALIKDAKAKGANVLVGGGHEKNLVQPTLFSGITKDMGIYQNENFGPVASIYTYDDIADAIAIANDTDYGLTGAVISKDENKAMEVVNQMQTGMCHINCATVYDEPHIPFGGVKDSGIGRHGGQAAIDTFTQTRWITLEKGGRHYPPPFKEKF